MVSRSSGATHKRHELRLQIGRKSRIGFRREIGGLEWPVARHDQSAISRPDADAGGLQQLHDRSHVFEPGMRQFKLTAGDRRGNRIGAGLDPVRDNVVPGRVPSGAAGDQDAVRAGALDARAHRVEASGEIGHFRLARRVEDFCFAFGRGRRHHGGLRCPDRWRTEHDAGAG